MPTTEQSIETLGFTEKEASLLVMLYQLGRANVSRIVHVAKQPRSSVVLLLKSLEEKDAIVEVRVGGHKEWEAVDPEHLYEMRKDDLQVFKSHMETLKHLKQTEKKKAVEVEQFHGVNGLKQAYDRLLLLGRGERILAFEGGTSSFAKLKIFQEGYTASWQAKLKKRGIVLEIALSEKILEVIRRTSTSVLRAAKGRAVIATLLPDELMRLDSDFFIFRDTLLIITPDEKVAIEIRERKTAAAFKQILRFAFEAGTRVDLNRYIESMLKTRAEKI